MEKKLRLGLVWGQRSGAMKAQIATAKFAEFTFSRDCLESPNGLHFVAPLACTTVRNGTFLGASRCQRTCHSTRTATFQTVSEETVWKSERAGSMTYAPEHGEVLFDRSV